MLTLIRRAGYVCVISLLCACGSPSLPGADSPPAARAGIGVDGLDRKSAIEAVQAAVDSYAGKSEHERYVLRSGAWLANLLSDPADQSGFAATTGRLAAVPMVNSILDGTPGLQGDSQAQLAVLFSAATRLSLLPVSDS